MQGDGGDVEGLFFGSQTVVSGATLLADDAGEEQAVLFAAVCSNARLFEKLGDDEAQRATERCLKRMERAVPTCGGRLVKSLGGELMAVFDHADEAAQAAIEMQKRVADLPPVSGIKLEIRAAFSYGMVFNEPAGITGVAVSRATTLAGLAGPSQVFTAETDVEAMSAAWRRTTQARSERYGEEGVFQLRPEGPLAPLPSKALAQAQDLAHSVAGKRLCVRYRGEVLLFQEEVSCVTIGRDADCDIVVHDRRASRHHARLERRGEMLFLVDQSTNGTFVTLNGRKEALLRNTEAPIYGKGRIAFAGSAEKSAADIAEFELI